jgi:hypothetical protein
LIGGLVGKEAAQDCNLTAQFGRLVAQACAGWPFLLVGCPQFGRLMAQACAGWQLFLVGRFLLLQLELHLGKLSLRSLKHGTLLVHLGKLSLCTLKQSAFGRPVAPPFIVGLGRPVGRQLTVWSWQLCP